MSVDEEKEFLLTWEEQAKSGGIPVVSVIRAALAQKLGRSVNQWTARHEIHTALASRQF